MNESEDEAVPPSILVVEDEGIVALDLCQELEQLGYLVSETVGNGPDAIEAASRLSPDLVLMDITLKGEMDGIEAGERIRRQLDVPVVFTTAHSGENIISRAKKVEPFGYILKPYSDRELQIVIEIALYRHRMERKLKKLQSWLIQADKVAGLGQLSAGLAHEINNPLCFSMTNVYNARNWLLQLNVDEPSRASLDKIEDRLSQTLEGLRRIRDLVQQLRTFARLDEGKAVDVIETINSVVIFLGHRLNEKIQLKRSNDGVPFIRCSSGQLSQIVTNLLCNAIDAVGGEGTIEVKTEVEGDTLILTVRDDGHGIPEEVLPHVFDAFFTTKPAGEGTGLGLAISKTLVEAHGGRISARNRSERGAEFTVRLPLSGEARGPGREGDGGGD